MCADERRRLESEWYQNDDRFIITVKNLIQSYHCMYKRSIPQIPSHWGETLEPRVTREHKKSDESLEHVRNRFQEVFDHVAEAFVCCLSFRVGYLEFSTMKARLLQLGLTSRPDDVDGVETCISFMGIYFIRMVRSVETKRMRGTKEKNRKTGRIKIRILSQHSGSLKDP